jgi:hypothetical protein
MMFTSCCLGFFAGFVVFAEEVRVAGVCFLACGEFCSGATCAHTKAGALASATKNVAAVMERRSIKLRNSGKMRLFLRQILTLLKSGSSEHLIVRTRHLSTGTSFLPGLYRRRS